VPDRELRHEEISPTFELADRLLLDDVEVLLLLLVRGINVQPSTSLIARLAATSARSFSNAAARLFASKYSRSVREGSAGTVAVEFSLPMLSGIALLCRWRRNISSVESADGGSDDVVWLLVLSGVSPS
jgi:hypothetical protein